ncbi:MAG: mechanosensitive ion channel [Anaerolineae bacterium]|nr:mechanosensitive ion channel [Anaerolineae bacterium]
MQDFIQQLLAQISQAIGGSLSNLAFALLILLVGWIVALVVAALVRAAFNRTRLQESIAKWTGSDAQRVADVSRWVGRGVFWLIMLFVLVGFFQTLQLTAATQPINALLEQLFAFIPQLLGAAILLLIAWIIASIVRFLIRGLFKTTRLDERLSNQAGIAAPDQVSISDTLGNVIYWFIFLLFLPAILGALNMQGLLEPVQGMVEQILAYLPNIFGAGLILLAGWFIARVVRQIVTNLLAASGADRLGERVGLKTALGAHTLSAVIGTIVYALILLPTVIAALNALQIEAISEPSTRMLTAILAAFPLVLGAAVVLTIAYFVGRLVSTLVSNVLAGVGFDRVMVLLGLGKEPTEGQRTPSEIVGYLVLIGIMLFSAVEAANLLGFAVVADLTAQFISFAGQVGLAVVVFALGLYLANLARSVIQSANSPQSNFVAQATWMAIVIFAAALAMRQTGIANDIINLAFGLSLGGIVVAAALAFGLGCRDIAAREVERWLKSMRKSDE